MIYDNTTHDHYDDDDDDKDEIVDMIIIFEFLWHNCIIHFDLIEFNQGLLKPFNITMHVFQIPNRNGSQKFK